MKQKLLYHLFILTSTLILFGLIDYFFTNSDKVFYLTKYFFFIIGYCYSLYYENLMSK